MSDWMRQSSSRGVKAAVCGSITNIGGPKESEACHSLEWKMPPREKTDKEKALPSCAHIPQILAKGGFQRSQEP